MKGNAIKLCVGLLIGALITIAVGRSQEGKRYPWLEPENPSKLDWLALEKQATEGVNAFGEDGVTINFYTNAESNRTGVVLCDLAFTHDVTAARLQIIEDGIQKRFAMDRRTLPWAQVKIIRKSAPF